jgi:hypothetical protein
MIRIALWQEQEADLGQARAGWGRKVGRSSAARRHRDKSQDQAPNALKRVRALASLRSPRISMDSSRVVPNALPLHLVGLH